MIHIIAAILLLCTSVNLLAFDQCHYLFDKKSDSELLTEMGVDHVNSSMELIGYRYSEVTSDSSTYLGMLATQLAKFSPPLAIRISSDFTSTNSAKSSHADGIYLGQRMFPGKRMRISELLTGIYLGPHILKNKHLLDEILMHELDHYELNRLLTAGDTQPIHTRIIKEPSGNIPVEELYTYSRQIKNIAERLLNSDELYNAEDIIQNIKNGVNTKSIIHHFIKTVLTLESYKIDIFQSLAKATDALRNERYYLELVGRVIWVSIEINKSSDKEMMYMPLALQTPGVEPRLTNRDVVLQFQNLISLCKEYAALNTFIKSFILTPAVQQNPSLLIAHLKAITLPSHIDAPNRVPVTKELLNSKRDKYFKRN